VKLVVPLFFALKCGGTIIREGICRMLDCKRLRGSWQAHGFEERNLYFPELVEFCGGGGEPEVKVLHNHPCGTRGNVDMVRGFGLKPIVMKRNIADSLLSLYEERRREKVMGCWGSSFSTENFWTMPLDDRKDFLVEQTALWFIRFYASWTYASLRPGVHIKWINFVKYTENPERVLEEIVLYITQRLTKCEVWDELWEERKGHKFNNGAHGRGVEWLGPERMEKLVHMTRFTGLDFKREGLL
jgi:hypothetical protein